MAPSAVKYTFIGAELFADHNPLVPDASMYGVLGLAALFTLVTHLSHARAGIASVLVAASAPLYYAQAPSMAGQATGMSALAIAVAGLGIAALKQTSRRARLGALVVGALGLGLGLSAHGVAFGVVVPTATVGLTWLLTQRARLRCPPFGLPIAAALVAVAVGAMALSNAGAIRARWLSAANVRPSFEFVLAELAHGFFPWSASLPFALASMTERPERATASESALRVLLLIGTALSYGVGALSVRSAGQEPFAGWVFVAGAMGLWAWDLDRGSRISRPVLASLALLVALLTLDFVRQPDTSVRTFAPGVTSAQLGALRLPGFAPPTLFLTCLGLTLAGACMAGIPYPRAAALRGRWQGAALFGGTLLGALVLRLGYYPALTAALSSEPARLAYEERARASDALGTLGLSEDSALHGGLQASFATRKPAHAAAWLAAAPPGSRRFVLFHNDQLGRLNAEFRSLEAGRNLPVLHASGLAWLAVNRFEPGELSENPLDELLFEHVPREATPLDVDIADRVHVLGWDVVDRAGQHLETVQARTAFRLRVYYALTAGQVAGHCTFLHIDHRPTRLAIEHDTWKEYPLALWRPGDRVVDEFEVSLPLHFSAGDYPVYFGFGVLPCQDDRRLAVSRGAHDRHRVVGGVLRVR